MTSEPTVQSVPSLGEPVMTSSAPPCPMCGGGLVPLRGLWRCSRCYFALCAGCEPGPCYQDADSGD
jgi:hypothetical protein